MPDGLIEQIPWAAPEGFALGRNIRHSPGNRDYARSILGPAGARPTSDVKHRNWGRKLYQANVGACTCFAAGHAVNSMPLRAARRPKRTLTNADCFANYRVATTLDPFPGTWEPDDTGSSGQAACQALIQAGVANGYVWAFGHEDGLSHIAEAPWMVGSWWYDTMFYPDSKGLVRPTGRRVGGHEYLWIGVDVDAEEDWYLNSWHTKESPWGLNGLFKMKWADSRSLIDDQHGDLVRPVITPAAG